MPTVDRLLGGVSVAQLGLKTTESLELPPFSSAKKFPVSPKPEKARILYPELLQALQHSNQSRVLLRSAMDRKKIMMDEILKEIEKLEKDLTIEADARIRLHRMNEELVKALREIDGFTGELSGVVLEAHRTERNGLGRLIEKLKALPGRWEMFKARQRQAIASAWVASDNDDRDE